MVATPLFVRVGGASAVSAVVDRFCETMAADPRLASLVRGRDPMRLGMELKRLLTQRLGGSPVPASSGDVARAREAARALGLDNRLVDAIIENVIEAFVHQRVPLAAVDEISMLAEEIRAEVLAPTAS